jgi:flagellar biosynthetic protein FlhB
MYERILNLAIGVWSHLSEPIDTTESVVAWGRLGCFYMLLTMAPLLLSVAFAAFVGNVIQVGWEITPEALKPKWNNLNLFNPKNYKKFFSSQSLVRLVLGFFKLLVIALVCYWVLWPAQEEMSRLMHGTAAQVFIFFAVQACWIGVITALILVFLAVLDFIYQRWKFMHEMRMSRTEVKDERKQTEGDVQVKAKLRGMMQRFTQNRMKANVPEADVVIANPIHYAIAIKYDPETMPAPICLAKGARRMALVIRELAEENSVPVVENPPLAQALYPAVEVGSLVPPHFYHTIAEVLAYVYKLNEAQAPKW